MATQIVMPQLGESVAEGVIGKWLKQEGDSIAKDEPIVEVVTDKVNAEIPSPVAGVLQKISASEGETVAVGQEIAVIGNQGETAASHEEPRDAGATPASGAAAQPTQESPAQHSASAPSAVQEAPQSITPSSQASTFESSNGDQGNGAGRVVRSSPLVQRLAAEHNVDLSRVPGTGIGGRVSKKDILQFIQSSQSRAPSPAFSPPTATPTPAGSPEPETLSATAAPDRTVQPASPAPAASTAPEAAQPRAVPVPAQAPQAARELRPDEEAVPVSAVRRMIADHMVKSKFTQPHATSMIEIDMTPVVQYRESNKGQWQQQEGVSLSFMAFVAKATVEGLKQYPLVNSEWAGDAIILKKSINLGLAVAAQDGLIVPNIKHADRLSLAGLAHAVSDLTVRARNGKLTPDDVSGGTFTLNNTGAIGSVWSVSIINYPQAGILSADAIVKRVRVMPDDSIAIRHMMNLCMSFDHRILDGATVADFLQFIRRRLEGWSPETSLY